MHAALRLPLALLFLLAASAAVAPVGQAHFSLDSGPIEAGGNWSMTFYIPREFSYHCHPHPTMAGSVTVVAAEEGDEPQEHVVRIVEPSDDPSTWGFEPAQLEVRSWDTVRWVNEGAVAHTVTEDTGGHGHGDDTHGDDGHPHTTESAGAPLALLALSVVAVLGVLRIRRRD